MSPARRQKLVGKAAKAMAKAEWRSFVPQAEAHVQNLIVDPRTFPQLQGRVKFKFSKEEPA